MLFVGTSIIHPSTEGVFLLCNILDLLIYSFIFTLESPSISVDSPLINSTLATYQSQCTVRNTNVVWVYKTVNEKKYKRLYNIETGQWIGDWIPA